MVYVEERIKNCIGYRILRDGITVAQSEKELAKRRKFGLMHARCPKDHERVYEIQWPRVVCKECGTQYDLAVHFDFWNRVHWKLAEVQQAPVVKVETPAVKEVKEVVREVVMIPCKYCGGLMPQTSVFCPNCGARRTG